MRRRHLTFQFSPFSFHFNMRRRHLTFQFSPFSFQFKKKTTDLVVFSANIALAEGTGFERL